MSDSVNIRFEGKLITLTSRGERMTTMERGKSWRRRVVRRAWVFAIIRITSSSLNSASNRERRRRLRTEEWNGHYIWQRESGKFWSTWHMPQSRVTRRTTINNNIVDYRLRRYLLTRHSLRKRERERESRKICVTRLGKMRDVRILCSRTRIIYVIVL